MFVAPLRPLQLKSYAAESALIQHLMLKTVEPVGMCAQRAQLVYLACVKGNVNLFLMKLVLLLVLLLEDLFVVKLLHLKNVFVLLMLLMEEDVLVFLEFVLKDLNNFVLILGVLFLELKHGP